MNFYDIIIVLIAAIGFILGFKDGFIRKVIGIIGFILAVYLAVSYASDLGRMIESAFGIEFYLSEMIAGVVIFLGVILVFTILKRVIHPFDKVNNLINQMIGGAVGVIQMLFFLSAVFLILNVFDIPDQSSRDSSVFYQSTYAVIPLTIEYVSEFTPKTKKIIKDYINEKDTLK